MDELEAISAWFEKEDIDLDQALAQYKKGMELVVKARAYLQQAENEFQEVKRQFDSAEERV